MDVVNSWGTAALVAFITCLWIFYCYLKAPFDYWQKRGVPYVKPSIIFGNIKNQILQKKSLQHDIDDIYKALEGQRFGGYYEFRTPVIMIRDPKLIEKILIKDFSYFQDRDFGLSIDLEKEPLSGNLFNMKGQLWKNLRNKLTPTFTTGKLKGMMEQMCNSGDELIEDIRERLKTDTSLNAKIIGTTFTIDVTSSVSFGLQFKANSPEGIKFRQIVDKIFAPSLKTMVRNIIVIYIKGLAKLLRLRQTPIDVNNYMISLVKATMEFRKKHNIHRNDFLQLMMNLKEQERTGKQMNWKGELSEEDAYLNHMDFSISEENKEVQTQVITDECIAAQSFVFLTGGTEAVANSIQFTMFELACNPEVQSKLQLEIDQVMAKYGGKLTYDGLKEMTYLDLITQERLRKYSDGAFVLRVCNANYHIPDSNVVIEKGTKVMIPTYSIHNDPQYYPEPEKFIPERFEGNNHRISGTYHPFGDGPRVCIAMRFVLLELKVAIAKLMSEFTVSLDPKTKVPLKFHPTSFVLAPIGGIWVKFQERTKNA
ncbi:probable cytochrome P450 6d4 [Macrosteles quadrilineatus]|uniref:probable cytochrome P450 6d4 n=1 Tax=Macrosteles quadrilineatus TaxID=74068 RepID=UPI0023E0C2C5|nr:probable cytochrome P450 6d4 [Macrosteles quadrilineatus]